MVFYVCKNNSMHLLYISIYFCLWRSYLWWALILHVAFSFTTCIIMVVVSILIAVCVVEFSGLHSNFLVCKLQFYTVNFTVLFCKCVYSFSVFLTKLFWQPQLPKLFCKNYRIFLQCVSSTQNFFIEYLNHSFYFVIWLVWSDIDKPVEVWQPLYILDYRLFCGYGSCILLWQTVFYVHRMPSVSAWVLNWVLFHALLLSHRHKVMSKCLSWQVFM